MGAGGAGGSGAGKGSLSFGPFSFPSSFARASSRGIFAPTPPSAASFRALISSRFGAAFASLPSGAGEKRAEAEPEDPEPAADAAALEAEADVMEISLRDGVTTAVMVRNVGDTSWSGVRLQVDGRYTAQVDAVPAGGRVVLELEKFTDSEGATPNPDMVVKRLLIEAAQGRRELPLR